MMPISDQLKREARVALSPRAQPIWFRIVKWTVAIAAFTWLWPSPYFRWYLALAFGISISVHFIWRWKTKGWTEPWGGWTDIEAGAPR